MYSNKRAQVRIEACIRDQRIYVLVTKGKFAGILRYSLFWQTMPFLDLLYIDEAYRGKGYGRKMMLYWEAAMERQGYRYGMLSTQADETTKGFYEKLGYRFIGAFLPPEQDADLCI